jgi:phage shock protein E
MSIAYCGPWIAWLTIFATAADRTPIEFTKDSLEVVLENVTKEKAVLVDVRSQEEWNKGHIKGSIFVPITSLRKDGDPKELAKKLPKDKILYTFCVVGMRAKAAAKVLIKHGYTVRALKPGYDDLVKAGFKKADDKKSEKSVGDNENSRQRNAR